MAGTQAAGNAGGSTKHSLGLVFEDAVRADVKARIAFAGPAGAGKTHTALAVGTGMGTKLGVIDTERGSAANYAGMFDFKHLRMPNSAPQTLVQALAVAADAGLDVVVIDSLTHFWSGQGGILDQVDRKTEESRSKNAFTSGWKTVKPIEHQMWDAILGYPGHVIATIRVKTAYEIQERNGKKEPVKIGLKPDQREGADYEFDLVGDLDHAHTLRVSKSRYPGAIDVGEEIELPNTGFGQRIVNWLSEGVKLPGLHDYVRRVMDPAMTYEQLLALYRGELSQRGLLGAALFAPDTGEQTTLGGLIVRVGTERKATVTQESPTVVAARAAEQAEHAEHAETRKAG